MAKVPAAAIQMASQDIQLMPTDWSSSTTATVVFARFATSADVTGFMATTVAALLDVLGLVSPSFAETFLVLLGTGAIEVEGAAITSFSMNIVAMTRR